MVEGGGYLGGRGKKKREKKLYAIVANKAIDFVQLPESWVLKNMTIVGLNLQKDLKGIPTIEMLPVEKKRASQQPAPSRLISAPSMRCGSASLLSQLWVPRS